EPRADLPGPARGEGGRRRPCAAWSRHGPGEARRRNAARRVLADAALGARPVALAGGRGNRSHPESGRGALRAFHAARRSDGGKRGRMDTILRAARKAAPSPIGAFRRRAVPAPPHRSRRPARVAAVRGPPASRRRGAPARGTLRRLVSAVGRSPLASETGGAVLASSLDPRAARLRRSGDPGADRRTPRRRRAAGKAPDLGTGGAVDRAHDSWARGAPSRGRRSEEAFAGGQGGGCPAPPPLD